MNNYKEIFESSVTGLLRYLEKNGLKSVVLGISGGIDSTVCAVICSEAVKRKPDLEFYGVSLPCKTNQEDEVSTADKVGTDKETTLQGNSAGLLQCRGCTGEITQ